ncbi:MAG TPA: glycoside hydrolase, partial [Candidatus Synoicihabitans sp.]|nr:glycoside hydrolase [Candidatus Synoicihabitans sp.]
MFRSFFFAGFEGTVGWNRHHQWIDQVISTQHDLHVEADYRRLREAGLWAAREAVRWPLVDQRHGYDFRSLDPFIAASERHDIDVVWDLFHYGYPLDLDPFAPAFVTRFAAYCHAVASYLVRRVSRPLYFSPVNEPSYLAWAAGEAARFAPHRRNCGRELKIALATAAIAGIQALREVAPAARIINIDPICNVV